MQLNASRIQSQKTIFSVSLEKSIAMLILPHTELASSIEQELQNNPLLEADFESTAKDQTPDIQERPIDTDRINAILNLSFSNLTKSATDEEREYEFF